MIDTPLGHFRVTAKLGEGGMGAVYRAEDTRLGRAVAIKVLPEAFTADPERLARFEREARALASLSHAHIAALYSFETAQPADARASPIRFLVMELAAGETLAQRLDRGAIPVDEALPLARQIAEALEEAHEKGIVHRDLKPANVKVSDDGRVKVLDFGLAKALEPTAGPASDLTVSPTLTAMATQHGVILGTAAYMSPEQAKGKPADKRADIWAFGVVLYEMLAGQRLFAGDSVPETMAEVLKGGIDLSRLPAETPPAIRGLVRRCLERDPRQRLHDIADARIVLEEEARGGRLDEARETPAAASGGRWAERLAWLAAGGLVAAGGFLWRGGLAGREAPGEAVPEWNVQRLTELPGAERHPTLSPDGRMVVYTSGPAGSSDLYLLRVGGDRAIPLTADSPDDDEQAAFSPDGKRVAYWANTGGQRDLWTVAATGGEPLPLTQDEATDWSPEWSPDGGWLYFASDRAGSMSLWRLAVDPDSGRAVGAPQPVTTGVESFGYPRFSRDGSRLAVMAYDRNYEQTLYALDSRSPETARPIHTLRNPSARWCKLSPDGAWLACSVAGAREDLVLLSADGTELRRLTADPYKDRIPLWTPDGQRVTFYSTRSGVWAYWWIRIDGSDLRQLTVEGDPGGAWSPDGKRFAWVAEGGELRLTDPSLADTAPATAARLGSPLALPEIFRQLSWAPQGDRIAGVVVKSAVDEAPRLVVWTLGSGALERLALPTIGRPFHSVAGWLPDGRRLIVRLRDGVAIVDTVGGSWSIVVPAGAFDSVISSSSDGGTLLVEREVMDADIWLLEAL